MLRLAFFSLALFAAPVFGQEYDLLLKGGHVVDSKNKIDGVMDVAIKDGLIAKVDRSIAASEAAKTVDVSAYYVTAGLVDLHTHDYAEQPGAPNHGIYPDGYVLRACTTTVVDAGDAGWRNFEDFKRKVIDTQKTRVLAMLNIVGGGMVDGAPQQDLADMDGQVTGEFALRYPGLIVGIKSAHYNGPEWTPYEQAVKAGTIAHIPVMIDYGARRVERPLSELLTRVLRPGDIYTHAYSGHRGEQDVATGGPGKGMREGRARGVIFDVGNGSGSFSWSVAVPLVKAGFLPDSISTDLYGHSILADNKSMLNVGDKWLALGLPFADVVADMTWHPAREIQHPELGNLSVGASADVAVLRLMDDEHKVQDMYNTVYPAHKRTVCEMTVRAGKVVWDLDGLTGEDWDKRGSSSALAYKRWSDLGERGFGTVRPAPKK